MTRARTAPDDTVLDPDAWDLPDSLTLEQCLDETGFPGPGPEHPFWTQGDES